jgi:hypothetical protein
MPARGTARLVISVVFKGVAGNPIVLGYFGDLPERVAVHDDQLKLEGAWVRDAATAAKRLRADRETPVYVHDPRAGEYVRESDPLPEGF